jgi:hypothetical protein
VPEAPRDESVVREFPPIVGERLPKLRTMGTLSGFAPWIVYWVLVGNVPAASAALLALVVAASSLLLGRIMRTPGYALETGSIATFSVLTILSVVLSESLIGRWEPTLSYVGLFATAAVCAVTGHPLVREFAVVGLPTDASRSDEFVPMRTAATRIWVGVAAAMTVASVIPPIAASDPRSVLSVVCLRVIPIVLFCGAAFATRTLHERAIVAAASPGVVRRTSFVAFRELAIDELYYLAREKVEREVGAGMEAYDVNVGSSGTPLTGDESRESWPATYKVRARS